MRGMGNMQQMMRKMQKMQKDMAKAQEEIKNSVVEASIGGGAVKNAERYARSPRRIKRSNC